MESLLAYNSIRRNEGYSLEYDDDNKTFTLLRWDWYVAAVYMLFYYVVSPWSQKQEGDMRQKRLARLLQVYPRSLICTHCKYILKRR